MKKIKNFFWKLWCALTWKCPKCGEPLDSYSDWIGGWEGYTVTWCHYCDGEEENNQ